MIQLSPKTSTILCFGIFNCLTASADTHTEQALRYATEAVRAGRDANALGLQAAEALKHLKAAMEANANYPELIKQLTEGEEDLKSAVEHARQFNTERAAHDAADAEIHLKAANTASMRLQQLQESQGKPSWPVVR